MITPLEVYAITKQVEAYGRTWLVPASAKWLAIDADGSLKAFMYKPEKQSVYWFIMYKEFFTEIAKVNLHGENWKTTLVELGK